MGRQVGCPWPEWEGCSITLPDEWLGLHAQRRDQAVDQAKVYKSDTLTQFAVALALLDDWEGIPGLDGPLENWDFTKLPLQVIAWINKTVLTDYRVCFHVPKVSLSPSGDGATETSRTGSPGTSEKTEP